jgi:hypothetical protein
MQWGCDVNIFLIPSSNSFYNVRGSETTTNGFENWYLHYKSSKVGWGISRDCNLMKGILNSTPIMMMRKSFFRVREGKRDFNPVIFMQIWDTFWCVIYSNSMLQTTTTILFIYSHARGKVILLIFSHEDWKVWKCNKFLKHDERKKICRFSPCIIMQLCHCYCTPTFFTFKWFPNATLHHFSM